jgi:GTPase
LPSPAQLAWQAISISLKSNPETPETKRRSLVDAQAASLRQAETRAANGQERAVLVALEFTGQRRRLTEAARLARNAAALAAGENVEKGADESIDGNLDFDAGLAEFEELARSAGAAIAATLIQRRAKPDPATLVGQGKLEEIEGVVASTGAHVVLFDHDLTPSQLRNLEAKLPCRVIDRTQLILDIFARHARTREGQLQVELAQLEYQLPRLAGRGKAMSQLGGGIGTRGPGETQLETDRRKINLRIDHVKEQLEAVRRIRRQQRQRREAVPVPVVALVGYTNAGKSTLFNALTEGTYSGAAVLESSRMFATLDPKLRQLQLPSRRKILLSDTVGFIRNLPHTLVTSFRATLEEVERAEVLLHVRDASSSMMEEQKAQVEKVLGELDVHGKPVIEVLNKIDLVSDEEQAVLSGIPGAVAVSGLTKVGLDGLLAAIDQALVADPVTEGRFRLPQAEGGVLAALEAGAIVGDKSFEGNLVYLTAKGPASLLNRFRRFRERIEARH